MPYKFHYVATQGNQTGFLKPTPHHNTGAKFVAQSNVNKLISHKTMRTGMGASRTSVRLRKGSAVEKRQASGRVPA